jgi:hypothetical protein
MLKWIGETSILSYLRGNISRKLSKKKLLTISKDLMAQRHDIDWATSMKYRPDNPKDKDGREKFIWDYKMLSLSLLRNSFSQSVFTG